MLGAIVKSVGSSIVKSQAKKVATDKLMGRGGKKGGATKETASNMVSGGISGSKKGRKPVAKTDGRRGYKGPSLEVVQAQIDAKETDKRIVKISKDVTVIAETMKGGLVLKEKAKRKERIAAEKDKRAKQESDIEKPDKPKKKDSGGGIKVPGVGLLQGIFGFITKFLYGVVIMKLIEFAPQLQKVIGLFKMATPLLFGKFGLFTVAGGFLDGLASFIDFGYKLVDGAEKIVGKIFGEEGAEKFRTFMENLKNLISGFVVFKVIKAKIIDVFIRRIKSAFKLVKGFINRGAKLVTKLFPQLGKLGSKLVTGARGLFTKGASKVGGFAAKIFGKAANFIAPAFKTAKPFASKFFSRVPVVGPLVVGIVSLLSGEPAGQAIFKAMGAALGGVAGSFIPIPILGTLIGETIGVFVGDLLYELIMGGGVEAVGQKLKDTFMTLFKGGKAVADWLGGGIKAFIKNVLTTDPIKVPEGGGVRSLLTRGTKNLGLYGFLEGLGFAGGKDGQIDKFFNPLNLLNPLKFYPLLFKSFFGKRDESEVSAGGGETAVVDDNQDNKNGANADAVAEETTYESGEGSAVIIPIPVQQSTQQVAIKNKRGRTVRYKTIVLDDTELSLYGGK